MRRNRGERGTHAAFPTTFDADFDFVSFFASLCGIRDGTLYVERCSWVRVTAAVRRRVGDADERGDEGDDLVGVTVRRW
jgi:hypothetical protein